MPSAAICRRGEEIVLGIERQRVVAHHHSCLIGLKI
jgi:hypothetical protein